MTSVNFKNTFDWNTSFEDIKGLFHEIIGTSVIAEKKQTIDCYPHDDITWLSNLTSGLGKTKNEIITSLLGRFYFKFDSINVFHTCTPDSVNSYYNYGFKLFDLDETNKKFEEFINKYYPSVSNAIIDDAIKYLKPYFLDHEKRKNVSLIYDSEYIPDLVKFFSLNRYRGEYFSALIERVEDYCPSIRELICSCSIPTVFKLILPLHFIPENFLSSLMPTIATKWFFLEKTPLLPYSPPLSLTLSMNTPIPPEYIDSHDHAVQLWDRDQKPRYCDKCQREIAPSVSS